MTQNKTPEEPTTEHPADPRTEAMPAAPFVGAAAPSDPAAPASPQESSTGAVPATIKVDAPVDGSDPEPMRPAARLPKLPEPRTQPAAAAGAAETAVPGVPAAAVPEADVPGIPEVAARRKPVPAPAAALTPAHDDEPLSKQLAKTKAALEQAANTKPVLTRVFQVLIAVFYPVVLLVLAIRLVTTPFFLWVEYHRPGFPVDSFGFTTDDRMTYGSYTVDYLLNLAGPRYLGDLVNATHGPLFLAREVAHMADVKSLITMAFTLGLVLAIVIVVGMFYLARRSVGGIRRALFAGSIATLVIVIVLGVLASLGWETFFTDFHEMFFANGTWTFYTDDTLIRLFPSDFWSDSGIFIGAFVLVVSSLTMAFTWPTKDRRKAVERSHRPGRRAANA